jgi:hypothetical protein
MNIDSLLNSKFWEHLTLPKVILYIFTGFCVLFYFKAETIKDMWIGHDQAKYGSVSRADFIDSLNSQEDFWQDSLKKVQRNYWHERHKVDSLVLLLNK